MTKAPMPNHSEDDADERRYAFIQHANGNSASGPPVTLPDEAPEVARDQVSDRVLSRRQSVDGAHGIVFWLEGSKEETDVPAGVTALTHAEALEHIRSNPDIWQEDVTV